MDRANPTFSRGGAGCSAHWLLLVGGLLATCPREAVAQAPPSREYQVKAACLLNFVQFIQWPASAFPDPKTPISIGILGDDPFGNVLEQTFEGELIDGRPLGIRRSKRSQDLRGCHLIFISKSEKDRLPGLLESLSGASTVTVSDIDDFAQRGGVISFYLEEKKVRFEINVGAARRKELKISSQLLKRAKIVD
jgi:hypothetical protein